MPSSPVATLKPKVVRVELHSANHTQLPRRGPRFLPLESNIEIGAEVLLTNRSLWKVQRVVHEFVGHGEVAVHVLVDHVSGPTSSQLDFMLTQ